MILLLVAVGVLFLCCAGTTTLATIGLVIGDTSTPQSASVSPGTQPAASSRRPDPGSTAVAPTAPASTAGTPSTAGTSEVAPGPSLPAFEIFERRDVSAGSGARRLALRAELRTFPVSEQQVTAVASQVVERHRGQGWQALSIVVTYDRREVLPSYAVFEWAPGGRWSEAATGDAATWRGYQLNAATLREKLAQPNKCRLPTEQAYVLNAEFNQATEDNVEVSEEAVLSEIAKRHKISTARAEELVVAVEDWTMC
ncbi:hypothetical protein [Micromonospora aurantiaca (nom. illeg.)]|uniref:hypothetical protein n=1 Tax=Micromonospora aurantiaca (nom. illeg.) TaxID=47850 RepID=UPI0037FAF4ED